jgi:plastocyanin
MFKALCSPFLVAPLLAVGLTLAAACGDGGEGGVTPGVSGIPAVSETRSPVPATETPITGGVEIRMVPVLRFDQSRLTVEAGEVTIIANNTDTGNRHSFAVFESEAVAEDGGAPITQTEICLGPCLEKVTFQTPGPGEYFFRCQVHPTRMKGAFIVR